MQLGPYLVEAELGRGGVGVVYRARRPDLDRSYALKVLIAGEDASPEAAERFLREARAAASLAGHPNVVGVHDVGREGNRLYIAMDLVEGRSLSELLDSEGIGVTRALAIAEAMAGALAHAHESGVIHRDVKPANVLLEPDGRARLADFGLARRLADEEGSGRLTRTGTILGTPAYMAPEQALGDVARVDARSDIYSLGAVLYEMLTGRPPFEGDSAVRVLHRVLVDEPVRPRRRNPAVSRDVETVCLKALEKDPARRYADARAFEADLARARQGLPVAARPVGSARRLALWARRHPASSAVATAAALATVGLVLALAADRREWERAVETARRLARQGDAASALA
ncbi:MAG: serine/threonine protein kinase, partial [Planctomycetes bacterium]|nr:serine/threonine protein kinase [Planctomycetota bacterium]